MTRVITQDKKIIIIVQAIKELDPNTIDKALQRMNRTRSTAKPHH